MRFIKDPDARLDYTWDWAAWLADGDEIISATITETTGDVTADNLHHTATIVTVWVAGGDPGTVARITVAVVTAQGRVDERTFTLRIEQR